MTVKINALFFIIVLFSLSTGSWANQKLENLEMSNRANPSDNLITGGQPTKQDLHLLAKKGIKTVINLRTKGEFSQFDEQQVVEGLGLKYVVIEVAGSDGINLENAQKLHEALGDLKEPALVHCASSNRVGGLLAYRAFKLQGLSAEKALELGKNAGMKSTEKKVRKLLE